MSTRGLIIGAVGLNASGKSTIATFFKERRQVTVLSLSDIIRKEIKKRGEEASRERMIAVGNELRKEGGAGVLAAQTVLELSDDKSYVVDSIRHPKEAEELRRTGRFHMIVVDAKPETRFGRLQARGRLGDSNTLEDFLRVEKLEAANPDPDGQQVQATMQLADYTVQNEGTPAELEAALADIDAQLPWK